MKAHHVSLLAMVAKGGDKALVFACHLWMAFLCNAAFWIVIAYILATVVDPPNMHNGYTSSVSLLWFLGWGISGLPIMTVALARHFGRMGR